MSDLNATASASQASHVSAASFGPALARIGRGTALAGAAAVLLMIGGLKFTQIEIDALKPLIGGAPWLAWLYPVFGEAGASYLLGVVEIATALFLIASPWSARAGLAGGLLGALTFFVTTTLLISLPVWETASGGVPALNFVGSFLIKDVALLGIALVVAGESLTRLDRPAAGRD